MNIYDHNEMNDKKVVLESSEEIVCNNCPETVIFHLKDNNHEFSMGLSTVIECLIFAVQCGELPKLPLSWLTDVDRANYSSYSEDERNFYFDDNFPRKRE